MADISSIKKELTMKVDERAYQADRNLVAYKLDVIMEDIAEIKQILKEQNNGMVIIKQCSICWLSLWEQ